MPLGPDSLRDLKSALTLSATAGLLGALTVPLLIDKVPGGARALPLPLPAFCGVLALQLTIVYGLIGWAGFRLARGRGIDPSPRAAGLLVAIVAGLACGAFLVGAVAAIRRLAPGTLPAVMHPPGPLAALLASATGAFGEEILLRLFALSALARVLPDTRGGRAGAVALAALLFGAMHAPAAVFLFGGLGNVPTLAWAWMIGLNGAVGAVFGALYLRSGIAAPIACHFATNLVWHVGSELGG